MIKIISGKSHGVESPVRPLGGCWYFHVIFKEKSAIFQEIRKQHNPLSYTTQLLTMFLQLPDGLPSPTVGNWIPTPCPTTHNAE